MNRRQFLGFLLPATAMLTVLLGLAGTVFAAASIPPECRPKIKWSVANSRWELISDACPSLNCPNDTGYSCDTFSAGGGYQGCGCPSTTASCVLLRKLLGGGLIDVICKKYCPQGQNCTEPHQDADGYAICDPCQ